MDALLDHGYIELSGYGDYVVRPKGRSYLLNHTDYGALPS